MSASLFTPLLLSVCAWPLGRALANSGYLAHRLEALDNRIFADSLLFQSASAMPASCALKCAHHVACVAFTFTAPSGVCRGHSAISSLDQSRSAAVDDTHTWVFGCAQADRYFRVTTSRCLRLYPSGRPHAEAGSRCGRDGGGLFMMKTLEDRALLGAFLAAQGHPFFRVWLGGEEQPGEGEWVWRDGEILPLNHSLWYPGEPNDVNNPGCLKTYYNTYLDDYHCDAHVPFACEILSP